MKKVLKNHSFLSLIVSIPVLSFQSIVIDHSKDFRNIVAAVVYLFYLNLD